jgi:apolipoprotein N-acyltransferase
LKSDDGLVIHSARENVEGLGHNMLTFQAADGRMLNQQEKWFVVPAGEFIPYIYQVALAYAGQERLLLDFNNQKSVNRGEKIEEPYIFDGVSYGAHACSGVMAPDFYNQLAQAGADIFTNSAALDTMGISPLFHIESKSMNQLTAIAHAKPFIQSAKGGPAYIIDKDGKTLSRSDSSDGGVASAEITVNNTKTIYSLFGDWVVYVSIVFVVAAAVWRRRYK